MSSKVAFITGASGGIGSACAAVLAAQGYSLALCYNNSPAPCEELKDSLAGKNDVICIKADVSDSAQVKDAFSAVRSQLGPVSVLVNSAGIAQQKLFTDITDEDFRRMMDTNVTGVFNTCREALPDMIKAKSGKIINISSMWGVCGASCEVHYSASKAAIIGLSKALAREVAPSGIQVNCVAPGVIDTKMNSCFSHDELEALKLETPMGRFGTPQEVASLVGFLASPAADYITAQVIGIDGAFI